MKLSILGQVIVGVTIVFGGIATPMIQQYQSQQEQNQASDQWLQLTLEALSFYDGLMGRPAYIAYQNAIYDVTNASGWSNGTHEGMHLAGQDCTTILSSAPHGTSVLNQLIVIGEIVNQSIGSSIVSSLDGSSLPTSTPDTCVWIETDDAPRFNRDEDDDHEDDEDDDHEDDEDEDHEDDEDEDEDHEDEDEDDGYWYCPNGSTNQTTSNTNTSIPNTPSQNGKYYLTLSELAYYDGTNGKPAWIAVYGNLYDVTNESAWKNGVHRGLHLGGKDASSAFDQSPHSQSLLNSLTHIGYLVTSSSISI